jgi:hypothetical protein
MFYTVPKKEKLSEDHLFHLFFNVKRLFMKQLHSSQGVELFMNNNVTILEASTAILNVEDNLSFIPLNNKHENIILLPPYTCFPVMYSICWVYKV